MSQPSNRLSQFWQELKRRRVHRLMAIYAGSAYVIFEASTLIFPRWGLPDWTIDLVLYLLILGAIVTFVMGWIYDLTPDGIQKTGSISETTAKEVSPTPNRWKIASYISLVVIVGLIVLNILPRIGKNEILDKSIAVLPFINESSDQENTYFINGMMESILDNLCKIGDLRVVSRNSVEQYRNNPKPTPTVAEEMDVCYVLEGSGQKVGNRMLLTIQLIIGEEDRHIWSKQYDRVIEKVEDLIDIQKEIAEIVVSEIEAIITPDEQELIETIPTTNLTAYDFYQRGREEYWRAVLRIDDNTSFERPEYFFNKALEYDPGYALAYSGLAMVQYSRYIMKTSLGANFTADYNQFEQLDSVSMFADKALDIDNQIADAYYAKGCYEYEKGNLREAMTLMQKALAIDPNHTAVMTKASDVSAALYDYVTALELLHKATTLERGSMLAMVDFQLFYTYYKIGFQEKSLQYLNDYLSFTGDSITYYSWRFHFDHVEGNSKEAFEFIKAAYAIDTSNRNLILFMGVGFLNLEQYDEAYTYFSRYYSLSEPSDELRANYMNQMGYLLWIIGRKEEAMLLFQELIDHCTRQIQIKSDYGQSAGIFDKACIYSFLGEKDSAYNYLEDLVTVRWHKYYISALNNNPMLDSIRYEQRFQQLLSKMEAKYQAEHERVRQWLEENDML